MPNLTYLDLSHNLLQKLAPGWLCPWAPKTNAVECFVNQSQRQGLSLMLDKNPWVCTCALQSFINNYTCDYVRHVNPKSCVRYEFLLSLFLIFFINVILESRHKDLLSKNQNQLSNSFSIEIACSEHLLN